MVTKWKEVALMANLVASVVSFAGPPCIAPLACETDMESPIWKWTNCCEIGLDCYEQGVRTVHCVEDPPTVFRDRYERQRKVPYGSCVGPSDPGCV